MDHCGLIGKFVENFSAPLIMGTFFTAGGMVEQNREHILVVDDEEELRLAIVEILTREGFEVEGVATAEEAWARLSQTAYDVLITDHNLPGKSGVDLLEDTLMRFPETI